MLSTHSISYKNLVHRIDELSLSELYIEIRTSPSLLKTDYLRPICKTFDWI